MMTLSAAQRRALRARAHGLQPVVSISDKGLTDSVLKEIGICLTAHELVKVRVYGDDRAQRETFLQTICDALDAAPVQHIGKLLVIWRPAPAESAVPKRRAIKTAPNRGIGSKRTFQGSTRD